MLTRLKFGGWWWLAICVFALPITASAADHLVHIGLNNQLQFTDAQSGTNVTVVKPGDTVTWQWDYVGIDHSSTSGTCPQNNCIPDNIWDSGLRFNPPPPPTFTRQFNTLGAFPYFCRIHGPIGMRGKVVVLNGPDYELDIANNSFTFPPSPIPVINTVAGQPVIFSGTAFGFLGYSNLVNLSCTNGSPRNPDNCPAQNVTPDPSGAPVSFNFSAGDSQAGTYFFDITGIGTDAGMISHSQQVELQVMDFGMTQPIPATVSTVPGAATPTMDFQVSSLGGLNSFISLACTLPASLPLGAGCTFTQNGFFIGGVSVDPNFSPIAQVNVTIHPGSTAAVGVYPVQIVGSSSFFSGTISANLSHTRTVTLEVVPADHLSVQAPAQVISGTPFNLVVTAADAAGIAVANYGQTVHFTSSDASIASPPLPADYTFVPGTPPGDGGMHTFPITLTNIGPITITVTDTAVFHENGRSPVILVQPSSSIGTLTITSSRATPPHFRDTAVTFTATVTLNSGSPSGSVAFFDGATPLGPATLVPGTGQSATATLTVQVLTIGNHVITAVYQPSPGTGAVGSISQPRSPAPRCSGDRCP